MIVLGIDPGTANTGFGVVERRGSRLLALDGGVITTRPEAPPQIRLANIHRRVCELLEEHKVSVLAMEDVYFGKNVNSAFAVGQARGVVMLAAGQRRLPYASYTPQQIKYAVCGSGRAEKDQVARMVQMLLSLDAPPRPDHAADALAIAICHINGAPHAAAVAESAIHVPELDDDAGEIHVRRGRESADHADGMIALVRGEVAVRRADHVVVLTAAASATASRCRPRRCATCRRSASRSRCTATSSCATTRSRSTASSTEEERDLFLALIGVQSVGPKVALAVLSGGTPRELIVGAGVRRRRAPAGGARHRQAHGRADHRRAAREGRRRGPRGGDRHHALRQPAALLARDGLVELGFSLVEADEALRDAAGRHARGAHRRSAAGGARVMTAAPRIQTPVQIEDEDELDRSLRPRRLEDFVGQPSLKEQLASRSRPRGARGEPLDHVLLAGPPGLGKTTLAQIVAAELGVPFVQTAGPTLERKADIAAFLTALEPRSVFFVDEIHRLQRALEETFYPAMEDRRLPITVGQGAGARVVTIDLPPFTLIGATTRAGLLTTPLRDRFGIQHRLEHYGMDDLAAIVRRSARMLGVSIERRRGRCDRRAQPRHAARGQPPAQARARLRRGPRRRVVRAAVADAALELLEVDDAGLDRLDREMLRASARSSVAARSGSRRSPSTVGEE